MLSTVRHSWLLFVVAALIAVASAMSVEDVLHIDGIEAYLHHGEKRQASGTGASSTPSETPSPSDQPSDTPTPTPTPTPTTTPSEAPSSSEEQQPSETPSNAPPQSSNDRSTPPPTPTTSDAPSQSSRTPVISTSPLVLTSLEPFTSFVFSTASDGRVASSLQTGSRTTLITTGHVTVTNTASLNNGNGGSGGGGGGLSESNKKIIGGVVGGVGGAILLGGLAVVAWRIWGRKKHVTEDDDDLMAGTGSALGSDKPAGSNNGTPFQSNLDQYHTPGGRPNAAANF